MTNLETDSRAAARFYNQRGTAAQWIKEDKLSCHGFRSNKVRLWLSVMAYNLENPVAAAGAAEEDRRPVAHVCSSGW